MADLNKPKLKLGDDGEIEGNLLLLEESHQKKKGLPRLWRKVIRNRLLVILGRMLIVSLCILGGITAFTELKTTIVTVYANRCPKQLTDLNVKGDKLTYVSNKAVYVMGIDGTNWQRIADPNSNPRLPVISPNGKYVAFDSQTPFGYEIYIAEIGGSTTRRVADHLPLNELAWSPDSTQIAFVARVDASKLAIDVINMDGSNRQRLTATQGDYKIAWLGASRSLVYVTNGNVLHIINADGSNPRSLPLQADYPVAQVFPSPDGKHVAFFSTFIDERTIYVVNTDGSNLRRLVGYPGSISALSWSFDSNQLAATVIPNYGTDIYVTHIDDVLPHPVTSAARTVTENRTPFWLPDSKHIVLFSKRLGTDDSGIYMVDVDGSNLHQVCARWPF